VSSHDVSGVVGDNHAEQMDYVYALRTITNGWTPAQKARLVDWFAITTKWRGGIQGTLNNLWNSCMQFFTDEEKIAARAKVPGLGAQANAGGGGGAGGGATGRRGQAAAPDAGAPAGANAAAGGLAAGGRAAGPGGAGPGGGARGCGGGRGAGSPKGEIIGVLLGNPGRGGDAANPDAGKQVFTTICAQCHRFGDIGNDVGPDLSDVRSRFTLRAILESIFYPSDVIDDRFALWTFELRGGQTQSGLIASEDDKKVQLKSGAEAPLTIQKSQIVSRKKSDMSLMPDLSDALTQQQIRDVLAFLVAGVK